MKILIEKVFLIIFQYIFGLYIQIENPHKMNCKEKEKNIKICNIYFDEH